MLVDLLASTLTKMQNRRRGYQLYHQPLAISYSAFCQKKVEEDVLFSRDLETVEGKFSLIEIDQVKDV